MDRDLLSLFDSRLQSQPDKPLYSFLDRDGAVTQSLTVAALFARAGELAALLQGHGLRGRPAVLLYPHGSDFIVAFFACLLAGAYPIPVARPRARDWRTLEGIVRASGAVALLSLSATLRHLPLELSGKNSLLLVDTGKVCESKVERRVCWQWTRPCADDIAFIQYTSGSTAAPKGVAITHANILHNCELIRQAFGCTTTDIGVSWLPFHHDMGLIGHIITPLYCGIHNYFLAPADFAARPLRWLQAISRYAGTISGAPDFGYELCHPRVTDEELEPLHLRSWRLAYCGAQKVSAHTLRRFSQRFVRAGFDTGALHPCYGMAEATLYVCSRHGLRTHRHQRSGREDVSIGRLQEQVDIRIIDQDSGEEMADEEMGEIVVRSPSVARGYYNHIGLDEVFGTEQEVVLRTGDLGYVHQGELYFTGRSKNLIKRRGRSFHAEDIEAEATLCMSGKGVLRCAAFELYPDADDSLTILLEPASDAAIADIELTIPMLRSHLCESPGILAAHIRLVPRHSLPLTSSGKLQRMQCRERFLSGQYGSETPMEHGYGREPEESSVGADAVVVA